MQANVIQVGPVQAKRMIKTCLLSKTPIPACLYGRPGVGKTQIWHEIARELTEETGEFWHLFDCRMSQRESIDIRGAIFVDSIDGVKVTRNAQPADFPRDGVGIMVLEELNRADTQTLSAALQLNERQLGDYVIPAGIRLGATCNYEESAGTRRLGDAMNDRWLMLYLQESASDWAEWASERVNGQVRINEYILSFIRSFPGALHEYDPKERVNPTPRSWERVSNVLNEKPHKEDVLALVAGLVGKARAIEVVAHIELFGQLPEESEILSNPKGARVPHEPSAQYAVATLVGRRIGGDLNDQNKLSRPETVKPYAEYLNRLPASFKVLTWQDAVKRTTYEKLEKGVKVKFSPLEQTREFVDYAASSPLARSRR